MMTSTVDPFPILATAFLSGGEAMDAVTLDSYQESFVPEADAFLLSAAAFREALGTEQGIEPEGLRSVDVFRDSFRDSFVSGNVDLFHRSWVAFAMLVRGLPQEPRTRAAQRVSRMHTSFFAATEAARRVALALYFEERRPDAEFRITYEPTGRAYYFRDISTAESVLPRLLGLDRFPEEADITIEALQPSAPPRVGPHGPGGGGIDH